MPARLRSGWSIPTSRSPARRSSSICATTDTSFPRLHDPQHSLVKLGQAQDHSGSGGLRCQWPACVSRAHRQLVHELRSCARAPTTHELDDAMQAVLKGNKPQVATASASGLLHLGPRMSRSYENCRDWFSRWWWPSRQRDADLRRARRRPALNDLVTSAAEAPRNQAARRRPEGLLYRRRPHGHLQSRYRSHRLSLLRILSSAGRGWAVSAADLRRRQEARATRSSRSPRRASCRRGCRSRSR